MWVRVTTVGVSAVVKLHATVESFSVMESSLRVVLSITELTVPEVPNIKLFAGLSIAVTWSSVTEPALVTKPKRALSFATTSISVTLLSV